MNRTQVIALATLLALGLFGCEQSNEPGRPTEPGGTSSGAVSPAPPPSAQSMPAPKGVGASPAPQSMLDDQQVLSNVKTALGSLPGVNPEQIEITVAGGVVTLGGLVSRAEQREQIVQFVSHVQGVQSVVDNLHVAES
jgi:hypothetical protein